MTVAQKSSIRPKLMQDSIFLPTSGGACVTTHRGTFSLKGKNIYRLLSIVAPQLNGTRTLAELCALWPEGQRDFVSTLIAALIDKGMVRDHVEEPLSTLTPNERAAFREQIAFADHCADRPLSRFEAFRNARIVLAGSGVSFERAGAALLSNGVKTLRWVEDANSDTGAHPEWTKAQADLLSAGVEASIRKTPWDNGESGCDLFIFVADSAPLLQIAACHRACRQNGIPFLAAFVFNGTSVIGPLSQPDRPGCWMCMFRRWAASMEADDAARFWRTLALGENLHDRHAWQPGMRILGNTVAFEACKHFARHLKPETEGGVLFQNLETMESTSSRILPHPGCQECGGASPDRNLAQLRMLLAADAERAEATPATLDLFIDERVGLVRGFADESRTQEPLYTTAVLAGGTSEGAAFTAHHETSLADARRLGIRKALLEYSLNVFDTRNFIQATYTELCDRGMQPVKSESILHWLGPKSEDTEYWVPASAIVREDFRMLPAAAIYPDILRTWHHFEDTRAGIASGETRDELIGNGLSSALAFWTLRQTAKGLVRTALLDSRAAAEGERNLSHLLDALDRVDGTAEIREFRTESPIACIAIQGQFGSRLGAGPSRSEALHRALVSYLGAFQTGAGIDRDSDPSILLPGFNIAHYTPLAAMAEPPAAALSVKEFLAAHHMDAMLVNLTPIEVQNASRLLFGRVVLTKEYHRT